MKSRSQSTISAPTQFEQVFKVEVDPNSKTGFKGLPPELEAMLLGGCITSDEARQNPQDVVDVLNFQMR